MTVTEPSFNPFDTEQLKDPYPHMRALREHRPVAELMPGFYYIAKHAPAMAAFRDHRHFSNAWMPPGILGIGDHPEQEVTVQEMDPPRHGPMRRLYLTALAPGKVADAEPHIAEVCAQLVGEIAPRGRADLISELAAPLPSRVIMHVIGVPEEDSAMVREWVDTIVTAADPTQVMMTGSIGGDMRDQIVAFSDYCQGLIDERRRAVDPPDDLITRMIKHEDEDGLRFTDLEILTQVRFIIMAGNETTTQLIGNLLHTLAADPHLYRRLREDRDFVSVAVEESLRRDSPVQIIFRASRDGAELGGCPLDHDTRVAIGIGSANRDEEVWEAPEEFRLGRDEAAQHLAFGTGAPLCVGAPLARLETRHAINAVLDRFSRIELAPGWVYEKVDFFMMRGLKSLEVVYEAS